MRVTTRTTTRSTRARWTARGIGLGLTTALAVTVGAGPASAVPGPPSTSGEQPVEVLGNQNFDSLPASITPFDCDRIVQVEPVSAGSFGEDDEVTILDLGTDNTFDFDISDDFAAIGVLVKGGPNTNVYDYRPTGIQADGELHAPVNPMNMTFYGLSHLDFCLVEDGSNT
ncbi:hypothetical protein [Streptomyces caeruleatus]|uniref:Uncharacterized protein n=1 Tax=Streptomyces caeruleatus TaxID=661399 RepID=A0A101TV80_9ACTN|nr:hypothetical protein [Streptomyces caeruleatus]KUN99093.1 hypothetical protein AQJ67_26010 [Streptomyces caeruleatus]